MLAPEPREDEDIESVGEGEVPTGATAPRASSTPPVVAPVQGAAVAPPQSWLSPRSAAVALVVVILALLVFTSSPLKWRSAVVGTEPQDTSLESLLDDKGSGTGVTGSLFKGDKQLSLPAAAQPKLSGLAVDRLTAAVELPGVTRISCKQWAVVTTIFEPSEAVVRQQQLPGWCIVVATDKGAPPFPLSGPNVVVLDMAAQEALGTHFPELFKLLPWKHFGRKNLGYLYAIMNGAEVVWDFDDDNLMREGVAPVPPAEIVRVEQTECAAFNPYPYMGGGPMSWPRGYPLTMIKRPCPHSFSAPQLLAAAGDVAVYQSLADNEPDVDGIFRLTQPIPFYFDTSAQRSLALPKGVFCPYNAQATLVLQPGLWSLLLPVSVHGRVSDIWRSYIAQRLLWDAGKTIAFTPPRVTQFRNPHNPLADMKAEEDLYYKSLALVQFLSLWRGKGATLAERAVELVVELYERQYVGLRDVLLTAEWMKALSAVGYTFPAVATAEEQAAGTAGWPAATVPPAVSPTSAPLAASPSGTPAPPASPSETPAPSGEPSATGSPSLAPSESSSPAPSASPSTPASATTSGSPPPPLGGRQLTFWTSDLHDGTRADVTSLLSRNGHIVIPGGHKMQNGPYPEAWAHPNVQWPERELPPVIAYHTGTMNPLSEGDIASTFDYYRNDSQMARVDAFICMFPFAYCELWMPFNKTIIFNAAHRYSLGRCPTSHWQRLSEHVQMAAARGHIVAAMGRYDAEYINYFTGLRPTILSTNSFYYAGHGVTQFTKARPEILVGPMQRGDCGGDWAFCNMLRDMNGAGAGQFNFVPVKALYGRFTLQDIANHRAAVLIPYAVLSYGITEMYALGVPLFVPTPEFLVQLGSMVDVRTTDGFYCGPATIPPPPAANVTHPYSPEDRSVEASVYWYRFADFYTWPHITQFASWPELVQKLAATDFDAVHNAMVETNKQREAEILNNWSEVVVNVSKTRGTMPTSYEDAIRDIWGVDRLQLERRQRRLMEEWQR